MTTLDDLRDAGIRAAELHRQSRDLLVGSVRQASRAGLSQREIAHAIGRSQPEVSRLLHFSSPSPHGQRLRTNRAAILALAREYDITNVRVFGSVATGADTLESDIDLLVDTPPSVGLFDLARFERAVSMLIGLDVDVVPARSLKPRLAATVLNEAIPL